MTKPQQQPDMFDRILRIGSAIRMLNALAVSVGLAMVYVIFFVADARTMEAQMKEIVKDRKEVLAEWDSWKSAKNEIDTQLIVRLEALQVAQERIMNRLERLEQRQ